MRATASQITPPTDSISRVPLLPTQVSDDEPQEHQPDRLAVPGPPTDRPAPGAPGNPMEALSGIHGYAFHSAMGARALTRLQLAREENADYRIYPFNGANDQYWVEDEPQGRPAKSITVYNPTVNFAAYVGLGGVDATSIAGAIPVSQFLTIPLQVNVIKVGFNPADLGAGTATLFVFRWSTVQPFAAQ